MHVLGLISIHLLFQYLNTEDKMSATNGNISVITNKLADLERLPPDEIILNNMLGITESVLTRQPQGLVGGIDSSDNLLLNIPDHPGAAIAGYSFSLVISDP